MRLSYPNSTVYHPVVMIEVFSVANRFLFHVYSGTNLAIETAKTMSRNFPDGEVIVRGPIDRIFINGKLDKEVKSTNKQYDNMTDEDRADFKLLIGGRWF